ncbi:MAG: delta-60 repeat domain-containing protein [Candidatus Zixiibacteriota bacterium]
MKALLTFTMMLMLLLGLSSPVSGQDPPDDPFGGGFPVNYQPEIFTMGVQNGALHGWGFAWLPGLDSILLMGDDSFPEIYPCGNDRDIAAGDFDGNFLDELAVAFSIPGSGVFVGIPTINTSTLAPNPAEYRDYMVLQDVLYSTDTLADILGEIRVVAGNFYEDHAMEFVLAYLAADSTVSLSVFKLDTMMSALERKATISDLSINTDVPPSQRVDKISRFDVTTGDFDGDGLDEVILVANGQAQSATDVVIAAYDYDTTGNTINAVSKLSFEVNDSPAHTCLRRLAVEEGNFDTDVRDEIAIMDRWANPQADTSRINALHILKLSPDMTGIDESQKEELAPVYPWVPGNWTNGTQDYIRALTVYNGELVVGGDFTAIDGVAANRIIRLNGVAWQPLGSGMNDDVHSLTVYNGDLIAGGAFTTAGGVAANCIARWDGYSWQPLGSAMNDTVRSLTVYNGELIAGGDLRLPAGLPPIVLPAGMVRPGNRSVQG